VRLGLVTSQHRARTLFGGTRAGAGTFAPAQGSNTVSWQLEASTWAVHARVERIASRQLLMRVPDAKRLQIVQTAGDGEIEFRPQSGFALTRYLALETLLYVFIACFALRSAALSTCRA